MSSLMGFAAPTDRERPFAECACRTALLQPRSMAASRGVCRLLVILGLTTSSAFSRVAAMVSESVQLPVSGWTTGYFGGGNLRYAETLCSLLKSTSRVAQRKQSSARIGGAAMDGLGYRALEDMESLPAGCATGGALDRNGLSKLGGTVGSGRGGATRLTIAARMRRWTAVARPLGRWSLCWLDSRDVFYYIAGSGAPPSPLFGGLPRFA